MKAAVYHGAGDVRIESVPDPREPGPRDLLLEVVRAGICGTDAGEFKHGPHLVPLKARHPGSGHVGPTVLGHEFVGRIVALGPEVEGFELGQRVVSGAGVSCGSCEWCRAGRTNLCQRYYTLGIHADGGLAELVVAPASTCYRVRDECDDDAAAMAQPLAVALHAFRRGRVEEGQSVVVIGAGGIGALIVAAAAAHGVRTLVAVDVAEDRLANARLLGATHLIDARAEDPIRAILDLTGGEGAHVVLEASGAPPSPAVALEAVRRGGRIVLVGLQVEPRALDLNSLTMREVELSATLAHVCDVDLPEAIDLLAETDLARKALDRVIDLDSLVDDGLVPLADGSVSGKILVDPR